jgi:hypothetical protein
MVHSVIVPDNPPKRWLRLWYESLGENIAVPELMLT